MSPTISVWPYRAVEKETQKHSFWEIIVSASRVPPRPSWRLGGSEAQRLEEGNGSKEKEGKGKGRTWKRKAKAGQGRKRKGKEEKGRERKCYWVLLLCFGDL